MENKYYFDRLDVESIGLLNCLVLQSVKDFGAIVNYDLLIEQLKFLKAKQIVLSVEFLIKNELIDWVESDGSFYFNLTAYGKQIFDFSKEEGKEKLNTEPTFCQNTDKTCWEFSKEPNKLCPVCAAERKHIFLKSAHGFKKLLKKEC